MGIPIYRSKKGISAKKNPYFVTYILIPDLLTEIFINQR